MNSAGHAAIGAVAAVVPDAVLTTFAWRRQWLPPEHPLVKAHRWLHSPRSIPYVFTLAWASHLVVDRFSTHREGP